MTRACFIFVPGHAGVRGNERADRLAGTAEVLNGAAMDRADIFNAARNSNRETQLQDGEESASLTRLHEHNIKRGETKLERLVGSQ